jgi:hypothetical protein
MWGIDITWCLSSSLSVYILIFFSETTKPIATKLGRNVLWLVPNTGYVFFVDQKYIKETQRTKGVKKGVSILMGIHYLLFICFWWGVFNAFQGRLGRGRIVVGLTQLPMQSVPITTIVVSSNATLALQHYVIKFVSDLQQANGFLRVLQFRSPIKFTATI